MTMKLKKVGPSVIMSDEEIDKLPQYCRAIIRDDREIEAECCKPVVSFDRFKALRSIRRDHVRAVPRTGPKVMA